MTPTIETRMEAAPSLPFHRNEEPSEPATGTATIAAPPRGFFQDALPANLILLTFFVVTLPLALFVWRQPNHMMLWVYIWLFGMTHFVLTFSIYFNSRNLQYFNASWKNRLIYFLLPLAFFIVFDLFHASRIGVTFPAFAIFFLGAIRLFDFNHLNRQSFGVLQMFKAQQELKYAQALKKWEIRYFHLLTLLLFTTFLAGGVTPFLQAGGPLSVGELRLELIGHTLPLGILQWVALGLILIIAGVFVGLATGYRRARRSGIELGADKPLMYLTLQTFSALFAVVSLLFYPATLAIHYVEYHLLMYPRCFRIALDESSRIDRTFAWMRRSPVRFYSIVIVVAGLATVFAYYGMGAMGITSPDLDKSFTLLVLLAMFDGLFVFHYLVETFIWRFSDPHFRSTLNGLYFVPKVAAKPAQ